MSTQLKRNCIYIPSIDAKDLYISNHFIEENIHKNGYRLQARKGDINLRKYTNSFDYSLDLIKLREVAAATLPKSDPLTFLHGNKEYSNKIINVTFKYSNKEFNKVKHGVYVKFGYDYSNLTFDDGIAAVHGNIIGIIVDEKLTMPTSLPLPKGFIIAECAPGTYCYHAQTIKVRNNIKELRNELYKNGFICEGVQYVRFKRSSGSARVGKCLFIAKHLYDCMHRFEMCGIDIIENDDIDLAALEAYISLSTSSIIDTLYVNPKSILIIDDHESVFLEPSIVTKMDVDNNLITTEQDALIKNSIFDGQSLIDCESMQKYSRYGMVLLRNLFFKSCCFNTNIQKWFRDRNITQLDQLNGFTLAEKIEDIRLITTPSSIKYLKFGTLTDWLRHISSHFGLVKHEKKTHFFKGKFVQAHYQLLNTVQLEKEKVEQLLAPSLDYVNKLNTDPDVLKHHVKCGFLAKNDNGETDISMKDKYETIYTMMKLSKTFFETKMYYDFKKQSCKSYIKNLKKGHILINGNYSVLFGNPYEMLLQSIGAFDGSTSLPPGHIHSKRYDYGKMLLGCRSPHISASNILLTQNLRHELIDQYFNLTAEIVCINAIEENILERLSGADFDSDSLILTDNQILIDAALKNYNLFKVPANKVTATKVNRKYTAYDQADLDFKTSDNKIGEIVNLSQELNSLMWSNIHTSGKPSPEWYKDIQELYYDICQLNVMSCIEIDKAKKEFAVNTASELKKLKAKYKRTDSLGRTIKPHFIGFIAKTKGYHDAQKKNYCYQDTTMDYVQQIINHRRSTKTSVAFKPFSDCFRFDSFQNGSVNKRQIAKILALCANTNAHISGLWSDEHMEPEDKRIMTEIAKNDLFTVAKKLKINHHTLYVLIRYMDNKKYSKISRLLFYTLFNTNMEALQELIHEMQPQSTTLKECSSGDLHIYGLSFKKYIEVIS